MKTKGMDIKTTVLNFNNESNSPNLTLILFNLLRNKAKKRVHLINAYFNNAFVKEDADNLTCHVIHFNIPYLNKIKCSYCGRCVTYCSHDARELKREVPCVTLDIHNCHGCMKCARSCTVNAITIQEIEVGKVFKTVIDNGSTILSGTHKYGENHDMHIFKAINSEFDDAETTIYEVPYTSASVSRKAIVQSDIVFVILPHYKDFDDEMRALLFYIYKIGKKIVFLKKINTDVSFVIPAFISNTETLYYNEHSNEIDDDLLQTEFKKIIKKFQSLKQKEIKITS